MLDKLIAAAAKIPTQYRAVLALLALAIARYLLTLSGADATIVDPVLLGIFGAGAVADAQVAE